MGWPSREDVIRQMGLDTTQWRAASELQDLLSTLEHQQGIDPDAKDVKGELSGFSFASRSMFRYTFHTVTEPFYDRRRKCLWYLGWRVSPLINFCASSLTRAGTQTTRISRPRDPKNLLHPTRKSSSLRLCRPKATFETYCEIRHVEPRA